MSVAALAISIVALALSAFTFWWLYWRPGRLTVATPATYAGHGSDEKLILEFPFVFLNDGAMPVVVDDLRLRLPQEGGKPLHFNATVEKVGTDEGRAFSTPFFVGPREAVKLICEFQRQPGQLTFEDRDYKVLLEGRLNGRPNWEKLHTFTLRVAERAVEMLAKAFIVHGNPL